MGCWDSVLTFVLFGLEVVARALAQVFSEKLLEKLTRLRSRRQTPKLQRLLLIVSRDYPKVYELFLRRVFANDPIVAEVVRDRRLCERRQRDTSPRFSRRRGDRREFPVDQPLLQRGLAFAPARNI